MIEAVVGWRMWHLSDRAGEPQLMPAGAGGADAWPHRAPIEARCHVPFLVRPRRLRHEVPEPSCRCGIYASRSLDAFERARPAWPPPPVVGRVSMWGRTIEHDRGWRARFAYPSRLRLVCPMCACVEPGSGLPTVVHRFGDLLLPFCGLHRSGIEVPDGRRTRPTDVLPADLSQRLLAAYAVDLLPVEAIEPLVSRPAAADPPAWKPTIRPALS